jgi:hypothetical protein
MYVYSLLRFSSLQVLPNLFRLSLKGELGRRMCENTFIQYIKVQNNRYGWSFTELTQC